MRLRRYGWPTCTGVVGVAMLIAVVSARPYAGSWNDGSRLATVESLVDRHTFVIDDSIYVRVPAGAETAWAPDDAGLRERGTYDKLLIDGHYYSDKSPVPAVALAAAYTVWRAIKGKTARQEPGDFAYWMTLSSSGVAYVVAAWSIFRLAAVLGLAPSVAVLITGSFAISTVALPYARHVNSHVLLLAVAALLSLGVARWLSSPCPSGPASRRLLALGALAGLGYGMDLAAGPVLFACTLSLVVHRSRSVRASAVFAVGALPWIALHHAINYAIAGTVVPANAVPAYLQWPGSPFAAGSMTGRWHDRSAPELAVYGAALLFGKRGFIGHNLPLLLVLAAPPILLRRRVVETPGVMWAVALFAGTWLLCTLASNNYSGVCASIRWFVPLLAPAYFMLALLVREVPEYSIDLAILSGWGAVTAALMWFDGPWMKHMVPMYWPIQASALLTWITVRRWRRLCDAPRVVAPAARGA